MLPQGKFHRWKTDSKTRDLEKLAFCGVVISLSYWLMRDVFMNSFVALRVSPGKPGTLLQLFMRKSGAGA